MPNPNEEACLRACHECAVACLQCATACLQEADPKPMARCIALDTECADICQHAVASIARGDEHMQGICALCARVCSRCAAECGIHDMDHCKRCAEACKRCAETCIAMAH
ncbi:MAG: four-helix bundle copper-binding protein [Piscinibacter sp.]|uniref:four-helix bundle copper-binding protein n=1 Tax=Piscinibacter sp. TaxID=1903157 RepID=UPI000DD4CE58|nr:MULTISPECIES: four-helix bundle copper-binding protein [Piscinibacter]MCW5663783.1 four-helix bundle copper-binding protein [Piscinibacter sp.]